jgi:hypothetical protein
MVNLMVGLGLRAYQAQMVNLMVGLGLRGVIAN